MITRIAAGRGPAHPLTNWLRGSGVLGHRTPVASSSTACGRVGDADAADDAGPGSASASDVADFLEGMRS
ncbi:hypothetical protein CcI49_07910 [Frankia sp. CcI49]|nr:hypothetical protein CcI49_07910 [Frankia sp. CcI49]